MNSRSKLMLIILAAGIGIALAGYYLGQWHSRDRHAGISAEETGYTCPMHPFVTKDRTGVCPICGMELVRKGAGAMDPGDLHLKEHVFLSPSQQVMADLSVMNVMYKPLFKVISAAGVIAYDQSRQGRVSAVAAGRIERLAADSVGAAVSKEHAAAELSSPDLVGAEEAYLAAYRAANAQDRAAARQSIGTPLYQAHQRLRGLGFTDAEFSALEQTGEATVRVPVYPPMNGIVIAKEAQEGQYVRAGDTLLGIADLSQVWADLEVYEDEFSYLAVGQHVSLTSRAYPGKEFSGRIIFIYPFFDPKTRTNRVRVALPNRQFFLKPDMLVQASIQVPLGTGLAVPAEAVVVTGSRSLVWVQVRQGVFVPREVTTGVRYRYDIQVLSGLSKNEVVAANGAYLVDAEARLQSGEGSDLQASAPPDGAADSSALGRKNDMDMSDMDMSDVSSSSPAFDKRIPTRTKPH